MSGDDFFEKDVLSLGFRDLLEQGVINKLPGARQFIPKKPEALLICQAQDGKREAFDQLIGHCRYKCLYWAMKLTDNRDNAEDLVQMAFQTGWLKIRDFRGDAGFATWICRIIWTKWMDMHKTQQAKWESKLLCFDELLPFSEGNSCLDPEIVIQQRDQAHRTHEAVCKALSQLSASCRQIAEMRLYEDKAYKEIGVKLGISEDEVKKNLRQARHRIRHYIKLARDNL